MKRTICLANNKRSRTSLVKDDLIDVARRMMFAKLKGLGAVEDQFRELRLNGKHDSSHRSVSKMVIKIVKIILNKIIRSVKKKTLDAAEDKEADEEDKAERSNKKIFHKKKERPMQVGPEKKHRPQRRLKDQDLEKVVSVSGEKGEEGEEGEGSEVEEGGGGEGKR